MTKLIEPIESAGMRGAMREAKQATRSWRAQYLRSAANRLDIHIEKLKAQAAEYRELARKLNAARS